MYYPTGRLTFLQVASRVDNITDIEGGGASVYTDRYLVVGSTVHTGNMKFRKK